MREDGELGEPTGKLVALFKRGNPIKHIEMGNQSEHLVTGIRAIEYRLQIGAQPSRLHSGEIEENG